MKLINKTAAKFVDGQKPTLADLQRLTETVNSLVEAVNLMLKGKVDLNFEYNDQERQFTISEAAEAVLNKRRAIGQKLRFKNMNNKYVEYSYVGSTLDEESWLDENNWVISLDTIDGGEF